MSNPAVPPWYVLYGDDLQALAWLLLALSLASSPLLRKALAQRKVGNQNRLFLEFCFCSFGLSVMLLLHAFSGLFGMFSRNDAVHVAVCCLLSGCWYCCHLSVAFSIACVGAGSRLVSATEKVIFACGCLFAFRQALYLE